MKATIFHYSLLSRSWKQPPRILHRAQAAQSTSQKQISEHMGNVMVAQISFTITISASGLTYHRVEGSDLIKAI